MREPYVVYLDGVPSGKFGDWRSGIECNFRADIGRRLNPSEEMAKVNDSQGSSAPIRVRTEEHKKFINEHNPNAEVIWDTTIEPPADLEPAFEDAADLVIKNLGAEPVPRCKHGNRVLREGTGKNGPYRGYGCSLPMKMKSEQCKMVWMVLDQNGKWSFRDEDADLLVG